MKKQLLAKIQRVRTMVEEDLRDEEALSGEDHDNMGSQLELLDDLAIAMNGLDEPILEQIFKS